MDNLEHHKDQKRPHQGSALDSPGGLRPPPPDPPSSERLASLATPLAKDIWRAFYLLSRLEITT